MTGDVVTSDIYDMRSDDDYRVEWFSGTGKGGQHRNKKQCSCRLHHIPTGLSEARQGRSRENNLDDARNALDAILDLKKAEEGRSIDRNNKKSQVGSGMRGDKTVTIRFQDDRVQHHGTGKSTTAKRYMRGFMDDVWES